MAQSYLGVENWPPEYEVTSFQTLVPRHLQFYFFSSQTEASCWYSAGRGLGSQRGFCQPSGVSPLLIMKFGWTCAMGFKDLPFDKAGIFSRSDFSCHFLSSFSSLLFLSLLPPFFLPFFISTSLFHGSPLVTNHASFGVLKFGLSPYQSSLFCFPVPLPMRKSDQDSLIYKEKTKSVFPKS